ncbi:hypothetical protein FRACYDRAFT_244191 [Fragilariopsis cylindrus CCMP1102]|uniref:Uncharacterized protein n=1 Tax=Fragilariopsis cylindrus CCMP1102 TaxID=635003 RepID=A0A1E7F445_9STRA|nr:hypothetical protein FRACYDRAFT_244191 [Fragilariopsis cylindrus CCMP1102]|eukprot:OEU12917.1 hypothetical protein FRACYDRAFT_244191 [Fragilariopsis cylindrus CCMP1102]
MDHPNLQYESERVANSSKRRKESCTWVSEDWEERCQFTHTSEDSDHLLLENLCPIACKICTPEEEVVVVVDASSSESSESVVLSSCVDFPQMEYLPVYKYNTTKRGRPKECDWVQEKPNQRCQLRWNNDLENPTPKGAKLYDYCPLSCGMCDGGTTSTSTVIDGAVLLAEDADESTSSPSAESTHTDRDPTTDSTVRPHELILDEGEFGNPCEAEAAAAAELAAAAAALLEEEEMEEELESNNVTTAIIFVTDAKESNVDDDDDEPLFSTFETVAIAAGIVLLLLLLLLCCTYSYYRKLKRKEQAAAAETEKEIEIIVGNTSTDSSKGSRNRFDFGRRFVDYFTITDVHQCTSAYCVVCESKQRQGIMSFDSYDDIQNNNNKNKNSSTAASVRSVNAVLLVDQNNETKQQKQLRQDGIIKEVVKSQSTGSRNSGSDTDASVDASHSDVSSEQSYIYDQC